MTLQEQMSIDVSILMADRTGQAAVTQQRAAYDKLRHATHHPCIIIARNLNDDRQQEGQGRIPEGLLTTLEFLRS
jgi:hypothetical protein